MSGVFNMMHIGHVRLFAYAKQIGTNLVVGVMDDNLCESRPSQNAKDRILQLRACSYVDEVVLINKSLLETLQAVKPNIIVKGSEFATAKNNENAFLRENPDCSLVFSAGIVDDTDFLSTATQYDANKQYLERHKISQKNLKKILQNFTTKNIVVIGDTIVDEYVECVPLGMSQEDPSIVVKPINSSTYIGGAAIVAAHAKSLGANVRFLTCLGKDNAGDFVAMQLEQLGILSQFYYPMYRPTTLKKRYRAQGKTIMRLSELEETEIDFDIQKQILDQLETFIGQADLIVLSDFSYGILSSEMVTKIIKICIENNVQYIADSQSSSQLGDISKFKNSLLLAPTEREAKLALKNNNLGITSTCNNLMQVLDIDNLIVTLGELGVYIQTNNIEDNWKTDEIGALNKVPIDPAGCGDSLFIASGLALVCGANIWEASYIGSMTAAIQVSRKGNVPITYNELEQLITGLVN